jgi:hypothetical protein
MRAGWAVRRRTAWEIAGARTSSTLPGLIVFPAA